MDGSILDTQELEAIRAVMRESGRPLQAAPGGEQATPIALIADDRDAERVRPTAQKLAARWALAVRTRIARLTGVKASVESVAIDTLESAALRESLGGCWTRTVEVESRPGFALVAAQGPMIEALAVRLLGGAPGDGPGDCPPSPTALRLFAPAGDALVAALAQAWHEEQACSLAPVASEARGEAWLRGLGDADVVMVLTLIVDGGVRGRVRLAARPETLVIPAPPVEAVPASPGAIEEALGAVPIQVQVELGRARMTMADLRGLRPGAVIALDRFVDDPLPVRCAGVLKALGHALIARGVVAVEIARAVSAAGNAK